MKTILHYFTLPLSLLLLSSTPSFAASDGIIHFRGQIVESPCDYQPTSQRINVSCYENGKYKVQTTNVSDLLQGGKLTNAKATASMKWVDPKKNLAILTVVYE
ncbi:type 1 fimbrial protein [Kluyvera chengduensis]|uniref:type 1 fimbrial protein n=1 Tax=Kluyvera sp. 142359 TaxID=3375726 RepID=UPI003774F137